MAGVDLPTNQIQDFVQLFKRKIWTVLICGLAGFTAAVILLCFIPPKYMSFTRVEVREVQLGEDLMGRATQQDKFKDLQNVSYQVLSTPRIVRVVKDELQWPEYLAVELSAIGKQEYLESVRKRTSVERARKEKDAGNDYITITYKDEDPKRAAKFANTIRDIWIQETIGAIRDDVQRQLDEARRLLDKTYKDYTIATQNVQRWQEQHGLSPVNPTNRKVTSEEDPVVRSFEKAKEELLRAESEMKRQKDVLAAARDRYASEPLYIQEAVDERTATASPQFETTRPLLDQLKDLKAEISKLKSEQKGLKASNKQFMIKQKTIDEKTKELKDVEERLAKAGLTPNGDKPFMRDILNPAKLAAKDEAARAEAEWETRTREYERAKNRVSELEIAAQRRAFIYTRYNQYQNDEDYIKVQYTNAKTLQEKKTQTLEQLRGTAGNPYRILDEAVPSDKPVEPPIMFYLLGGIVGGGGAALGLIFLRELARSSYRSAQDAAASLSLPVLGYVNRMDTRIELEMARKRQLFSVTTSLAAILLLGGTATLYLLKPVLLPETMKNAIDSVKSNFK